MNRNGLNDEAQPMRLYDYETLLGSAQTESFPESFTLSRKASIKNQGSTSACCACAIATAAEYIWGKEMSEGWNYGRFRDNARPGLFLIKALELWRKIGTVPLADFGILCEVPEIKELTEKHPELTAAAQKYRISGYAALNYANAEKKDTAIKEALTNGKIVLIAAVPKYFREAHAVVIDGWNDKEGVYTIQNSWGKEWGSGGYGEVPKGEVGEVYAVTFDEITLPFTDVSKERWSYGAIKNMYLSGLMNGKSADQFDPSTPMTREETAAILDRLTKRLDERLERIYGIICDLRDLK